MPSIIDAEKCIGCGICVDNCPGDNIYMNEKTKKAFVKYPKECWYCGSCRMDCPENCITIEFPLEVII